MKKAVLIILLISLCCMDGIAQQRFTKPPKSTRQSHSGLSNYNLGVKAGCPWNVMTLSKLDNTTYKGLFGYLLGITGERNFNRFSIALESTFAQKGTRMENTKLFQTSLDDDPPTGTLVSRYTLAYNVITVRLPLTWYLHGFFGNDNYVPYLFVGPEIDIQSPVSITLADGFHYPDPYCVIEKSENGAPWITSNQPAPTNVFNASAVGGLGLMIKIPTPGSTLFLKFDAAVNYGIMDLSSKAEEHIHAHDVELNATVLFPIKKRLHDACYSFR